MRILVACECSGRTREAFRRAGHDAWSCDLKPAEDRSPFHYTGDMFEFERREREAGRPFGAMLSHPTCTYLCSSGLHWNKRGKIEADGRPRSEHTEDAIDFCRRIMALPIRFKAMENPIGCLSTRIRKPEQIIQPHWFGDDASKATCLWLDGGLPKLVPTKHVLPRAVCPSCKGRWFHGEAKVAFERGCPACGEEAGRMLARWGNQTDSGQNNLGPSDTRDEERSRTYQGIADAIGTQWGKFLDEWELFSFN